MTHRHVLLVQPDRSGLLLGLELRPPGGCHRLQPQSAGLSLTPDMLGELLTLFGKPVPKLFRVVLLIGMADEYQSEQPVVRGHALKTARRYHILASQPVFMSRQHTQHFDQMPVDLKWPGGVISHVRVTSFRQ